MKLNQDTEIRSIEELDIEIPNWIDQAITVGDIQAIVQGGCASGAYMKAVTYYDALNTMRDHGDEVLDFIEGNVDLKELIQNQDGISWAGLACLFLSYGVELWALGVDQELEGLEDLED